MSVLPLDIKRNYRQLKVAQWLDADRMPKLLESFFLKAFYGGATKGQEVVFSRFGSFKVRHKKERAFGRDQEH